MKHVYFNEYPCIPLYYKNKTIPTTFLQEEIKHVAQGQSVQFQGQPVQHLNSGQTNQSSKLNQVQPQLVNQGVRSSTMRAVSPKQMSGLNQGQRSQGSHGAANTMLLPRGPTAKGPQAVFKAVPIGIDDKPVVQTPQSFDGKANTSAALGNQTKLSSPGSHGNVTLQAISASNQKSMPGSHGSQATPGNKILLDAVQKLGLPPETIQALLTATQGLQISHVGPITKCITPQGHQAPSLNQPGPSSGRNIESTGKAQISLLVPKSQSQVKQLVPIPPVINSQTQKIVSAVKNVMVSSAGWSQKETMLKSAIVTPMPKSSTNTQVPLNVKGITTVQKSLTVTVPTASVAAASGQPLGPSSNQIAGLPTQQPITGQGTSSNRVALISTKQPTTSGQTDLQANMGQIEHGQGDRKVSNAVSIPGTSEMETNTPGPNKMITSPGFDMSKSGMKADAVHKIESGESGATEMKNLDKAISSVTSPDGQQETKAFQDGRQEVKGFQDGRQEVMREEDTEGVLMKTEESEGECCDDQECGVNKMPGRKIFRKGRSRFREHNLQNQQIQILKCQCYTKRRVGAGLRPYRNL